MRFPYLTKLQDRVRQYRRRRANRSFGIAKATERAIASDDQVAARIALATPLEELRGLLESRTNLDFLHVDHTAISSEDGISLINLARRSGETKAKLIYLANAGFHVYALRNGVTSLVRHRRIRYCQRRVCKCLRPVNERRYQSKTQKQRRQK